MPGKGETANASMSCGKRGMTSSKRKGNPIKRRSRSSRRPDSGPIRGDFRRRFSPKRSPPPFNSDEICYVILHSCTPIQQTNPPPLKQKLDKKSSHNLAHFGGVCIDTSLPQWSMRKESISDAWRGFASALFMFGMSCSLL